MSRQNSQNEITKISYVNLQHIYHPKDLLFKIFIIPKFKMWNIFKIIFCQ